MFGLHKKMSSKDLEQQLAKKEIVVIDVREVEEYKEGHIPGSINIPLSLLPLKIKDIASFQDHIVVHCLSGGRSASAKQYLIKEGYKNTEDFGGIHRYESPLVK